MIRYEHDKLVIELATRSPEAMHDMLIRGLNTAVRMGMLTPDPRNGDMDRLVVLTDLLDGILPDERQLKGALKGGVLR